MAAMISSCALDRFCAQRVPLPVSSSSASAQWRASARVFRIWLSTAARAAADFGACSPITASSSLRMAAAGLGAKTGFRVLASASASVIADFLQLVERFNGLFGGHLVGSNGIKRQVNRITMHNLWCGLMREQRQIV